MKDDRPGRTKKVSSHRPENVIIHSRYGFMDVAMAVTLQKIIATVSTSGCNGQRECDRVRVAKR
jgi:hypothetical protein